jgi:MFS transporter, DHA1 family, multidrug resistance protein
VALRGHDVTNRRHRVTGDGLIASADMPHSPPTSALSAQQPLVSVSLAALALALLLGLQPLSTDVYLPALPMLARDLAAPMSAVQLTMSALILAFGVAQMFWGPLADRLGRRPVLLLGLALYTLASLGCAWASDIQALVVWRACQGAALAAAVVCARAIVRDLYEPTQGAQVMALGLSGLGVIALTGPLLGGVAAAQWGWRAPLWIVAAMGALTWLFVSTRLPETLRAPNPAATRLQPLLRQWREVGRHPVFLAWASLVACTYGGLFTILAASSFAYIDVLHLSPATYGMVMAVGSASYLSGTFLCRRWIRRHGMAGTVWRGAWFTLAGGLSILGLVAAGVQAVWAVLLPQCLFAFGHGLHQPCGQAGLVGPFPHAAGTASALAGLLLALVAFAIGRWLGVAMDGSLWPMASALGFWAILTWAVALWWVPRVAK